MIDASTTAITLVMLLTDEELEPLEKRAGDVEIAGRGRPDQMSQVLNRLRVVASLPMYSRQCPRRSTADGWRDLLESDPSRPGPVYDKTVSRPQYCFRGGISALLTNGDYSLMWIAFGLPEIRPKPGGH